MIVSDYYTIIVQVHRVVTFVALYYQSVFVPIYVFGVSYGQVNIFCIVHYSFPKISLYRRYNALVQFPEKNSRR